VFLSEQISRMAATREFVAARALLHENHPMSTPRFAGIASKVTESVVENVARDRMYVSCPLNPGITHDYALWPRQV
jgi:hypothetical protein